MKNVMKAGLAAFVLLILNVQSPPNAYKAVAKAAVTIPMAKGKEVKIDPSASQVTWIGTKPSGKHNGTIGIETGFLTIDKDAITGGNLVIDMKTITDTDMTGNGKAGLEKHLKSPDFFDVEKFATGKFEIASVAAVEGGDGYNVIGNLTLKGITKSITFPAAVSMKDGVVTATANFNIDRTMWDITYGADGKIAKEVNIGFNLIAK
jgi:polyisoprenoid-binding protein YceI